MVAIAKQSGHMIQVTAPTAGYSSGQLIELTDIVAIVEDTVAASAVGAAHLTGVFTLTTATGATTVFAQGDSVYVTTAGVITNVSTSNQFVGTAMVAATSGEATVDVNINFGPG